MTIEPIWLTAEDANAIHSRQLAEHGGLDGIRDSGLLESALARPINRWNYGDDDPAALAATYAAGLAKNHPYLDGNKRTAWVLARLFLLLNGHALVFTKEDATRMMLDLAGGVIDGQAAADWFREHLQDGKE